MEQIINKVANSKLVTIDLEDYYPEGKRVVFDIKDFLYESLILREKEFREQLKNHNWAQYQGNYVALTCSTDAIIPAWTYMLVTAHLIPFTKKVIVGSMDELESIIYSEILENTDFSPLNNLPVIIKGCGNKPIPQNAYLLLIQKVQPFAKSIMYGEACSTVPLIKKRELQF